MLQSTPGPSTPSTPRPATPGPSNVGKGTSSHGRLSGGRVQIKRKLEPEADQPAQVPTRPNTPVAHAAADVREDRQLPPHLSSHRGDRQRAKTAPSSARTTPDVEVQQPKRQRGLVAEPSVPSLLSRLALAPNASESKLQVAPAVPAKRRAETDGAPQQQQKRPNQQRGRPTSYQANTNRPAEVGLSIKGAAARANQPPSETAGEASLLNRLNRSDQGGGSSSRPRKRTKT